MPRVPSSLRDLVRRRANDTCEYCQMPQEFYRSVFQPDHIIAEAHRGATVSPVIGGLDPDAARAILDLKFDKDATNPVRHDICAITFLQKSAIFSQIPLAPALLFAHR